MSASSSGKNSSHESDKPNIPLQKQRTTSINSDRKNVQDLTKKGKADSVKTRAQKKLSDVDIQGITEKDTEVFLETKENEGTNNIFKPRHSIMRSPTCSISSVDISQDTEQQSRKRTRSDSSPGNLEQNKIRKKFPKNNLQNTNKYNDSTETEQNSKNNTRNALEGLLDYLGVIHNYLEVSVCTENETNMSNPRNALFNVHRLVTMLSYNVGQLEKENASLKQTVEKLKGNPLESNQTISNEVKSKTQQRTYSEIIKANNNTSNSEETQMNPKWKTPTKEEKYELLIKIEKEKNPKSVVQEIKQNLKANQIRETVKRVKQLESGGVVMQFHNVDQQRKIKDSLSTNSNFQLKEKENTFPMIMVTGIDKGYTSDQFINELIEQNSDIKDNFGNDIKTQIKYITKKPCRDIHKENWVLQVPPTLFKWIMKGNNLSFDLMKAYVTEYFNVAICFKCCNFGHVSKYCKSPECCHKCGGSHHPKNCSEETNLDCPNCKRLRLVDRKHSARDQKCPAFLLQVKKTINHTTYDHFLQQNIQNS